MYLFQPDNCQNYHSGWIMPIIRTINYRVGKKKDGFRGGNAGMVIAWCSGNVPDKLQGPRVAYPFER